MRKLVVQNLSAGLYYDLDEEELNIVLIRGDQETYPGAVTSMEFGGFTAFNPPEIRKKIEGLKSPAGDEPPTLKYEQMAQEIERDMEGDNLNPTQSIFLRKAADIYRAVATRERARYGSR